MTQVETIFELLNPFGSVRLMRSCEPRVLLVGTCLILPSLYDVRWIQVASLPLHKRRVLSPKGQV
jgi:hypothetical protein